MIVGAYFVVTRRIGLITSEYTVHCLIDHQVLPTYCAADPLQVLLGLIAVLTDLRVEAAILMEPA